MPQSQSVPLPTVTPQDLALGLTLLAPVLIVIGTGIVVLLIDLIITDWLSRRPLMWIASLGLLVALASIGVLAGSGFIGQTAFGGFLVLDGFALFFQALFVLAAILVILSATTFADREELVEAEFYIMVLFSTGGLMLMASGNELMSIYLALEVTSLSLAFLAAWNKSDSIAGQGLKSTEAGIKFFLLSAMSSAVLLYGLGNVSQGMIAKLLGVSHVAVYKWVRKAGEAAPEPAGEPSSEVVQIDEMWHFVNGKKTRFGSGGPTTLWHGEPWPGSWVGVMMRPAGDFSTRSASRAVNTTFGANPSASNAALICERPVKAKS